MRDNVVITLGSPYGIGYEIFLRTLANNRLGDEIPVCVGSLSVVNYFTKFLSVKLNFEVVDLDSFEKSIISAVANEKDFVLVNIDSKYEEINDIKNISPEFDGGIALHSIQTAADLTKTGFFDGVVTLPVSKKNINTIEPSFLGHTEYLQKRWGQREVFMTFVSPKFTVVLVTTHIPLSEVARQISEDTYNATLTIALKLKKELKITKDICALGLNPHAGEGGIIGKKEILMNRLIKNFNEMNNCNIIGPIPADTAFTPQNINKFGLYIANYHDQGLIPFKIFAFREGVNLSYGMDYIRTSVDHGTGVDLIGKNPDPTSFFKAYEVAKKIINNR